MTGPGTPSRGGDEGPPWTDRQTIAQLRVDLAAAHSRIRHLTIALTSARHIGAAIGIVMSHTSDTEAEAFSRLVRTSRASGRKLREVADDVVRSGNDQGYDLGSARADP